MPKYVMTSAESVQANSHTIISLLYKTTTCLTPTATTFFCPHNEKHLSKTATAKFYQAEKWLTMHKKQTSLQLYLFYLF